MKISVLRSMRFLLAGLGCWLLAVGSPARDLRDLSIDGLTDLSLEELLDIEVSVSSKTENKPLRETPGIITVITAEEIANSGARDLIDVLRLVPGFDFGLDVYEVTGPGLRGSWAYEGKVLLLVDGIEMNERQYGTLQFGSHYPLDNIKRIEIIRGPGSVNYGGFAELGVINIITQDAKDSQGVQAGLTYGQMMGGWGRKVADLMYGGQFDNGLELTAAGYAGESLRSDREYVSLSGQRQDMRESSRLEPSFLNLGLRYGGFSSRFLADDYHTVYRNRFGEPEANQQIVDFKSWRWQAKYAKPLNEFLNLELEGGYMHENSWQEDTSDPSDPETAVKGRVQHFWGKSGLKYRFSEKLKLAAGLEWYKDQGDDKSPLQVTDMPDFHNAVGYIEGDYTADWANLTLGLRYDRHSLFGSNIEPRAAITKVYGKFHYKFLYSHAFRTPVTMNLSYNSALQPERSQSWEAEAGYQFNSDMGIAVNLFDNKIEDTIIYGVDPLTSEDSYFNASATGTRGIETEFRLKQRGHYLTLNHAYYQTAYGVAENQRVFDFQNNNDNSREILGLPAHKITLNAHARLDPQWSFNSSLIWQGRRYGYTAIDEENNPVLHKFGGDLLVNLFFRYKPEFAKNLEIGFGVYDLLNADPVFIQPFNGGSAPLPGPSREWLVKLRYHF